LMQSSFMSHCHSAMRASVLCFLFLVVLVTTGQSQSSRGTVTGVVQDAAGGVIANATVTLRSPSMGVVFNQTTNGSGIYRFDAILPGDYVLTTNATGFAQGESPVTVTAGSTVGRDFSLAVGRVGVTVEVASTSPVELQTEEATRGDVLSSTELATLPIRNQNSLNLILTLPGVVRSNQGGSLDTGIGSVNGARARSNNFLLDGVQNNDISVAGPAYAITNNDGDFSIISRLSRISASLAADWIPGA